MYKRVFPTHKIQLQNSSNTPAFICFRCQSDLKMGMSFRRLCIKNEKKWQTQVEEIKDSSQSDQESSIPSDVTTPKLERDNHSNPIFKSESTYRESESDEGPQKTVEILIKESKIINHLVFTDVQEQERDHLAQDFIINATEDIDEEETEQNEIEYEPIVIQSSKVYSNICKPNHETAIYICELCGTHARSKVSFERHIRKHTGERPFACEYVCHLRNVHILAFITTIYWTNWNNQLPSTGYVLHDFYPPASCALMGSRTLGNDRFHVDFVIVVISAIWGD